MDNLDLPLPMPEDQLLALDEAMVDSQAAEVVKLCFFADLTQQQVARVMNATYLTGYLRGQRENVEPVQLGE